MSVPNVRLRWIPFLLVGLVNGAILWFLHDHYWYPSDEGIYAHIAQRLLHGEVLGRDVQSLHPGYINFLNAAAMRAFGEDLLSMRYPLALAALIQSCLLYVLFERHGVLLAFAASAGSIALGVVQFLNPTAHWYCLSLAVFLIWWLSVTPSGRWWRLVVTGAVIGVVVLLRQLTGVWMAFGVLAIIFAEDSDPGTREGTWMARAVLALAIVLLASYLVAAGGSRPLPKLMVGLWPLLLLGVSFMRARVPNRSVFRTTVWLTAGAAAAAAPLAIYLIAHAAVRPWLGDALAAVRLTDLEYMRTANWLSLAPLLGLLQVLRPADIVSFVNGLYWTALPLLPIVNGPLTVRALWHGSSREVALPVIAAFYALVSLHLEGSMYWYFSVGLSLAGCLWHARTSVPVRRIAATAALGLAVIGLVFHAAQSASRSFSDRMNGELAATTTSTRCDGLPHASLRIEPRDCETYRRVVELIRTHASPNATILAVPHDPEMYFLSGRRNPFRFYSTGLGIRNEDELNEALAKLAVAPPAVVTYRPDDKFNNASSARIMTLVRQTHTRVGAFGGLEVYVRAEPAAGAGDRQE